MNNEKIILGKIIYPHGEWENKCPKCKCISLNFVYSFFSDKWLCPCCDRWVDLYAK